jgi:lambda family phage tail tape measure protein
VATIQGLAFKVLAQVTGAQQFDDLAKKVNNVQTKALSLNDAIKTLGLVFVAKQAATYAESVFEAGDQLNKLSQKTGVAVSTLAQFQVAGELADVSTESLAKNLNKLGVNIVNAAAGNQDFAGTFKNLGINLRDSNGNLKNAGDVTLELADKFKGMKDGAEKAAVATKLFGKSGFELIPFLDQGSDGIKKFALAIDDDFAKRSETFNDTLKLISLNFKNLALNSLKDFLPQLQDLANAFQDFTKNVEGDSSILTGLAEVIRFTSIGVVYCSEAFDSLGVSAGAAGAIINQTVRGNFAEAKQIAKDLSDYYDKQDKRIYAFVERVNKNSRIFGEGTAAAIAAREKAETAPATNNQSGRINGDIIGENQKILKQFDERIAKLKAEAAAVGQSNVQKQAGVIIAELESKGIDKSSKSYAIYSQKITAAVTALVAAQEKQESVNLLRKEQESFDLQKLQLDNYALSAAQLQKLTTNKELDNQATEATINFTEKGKAAYLAATEAVKAQRAALVDLQTEQKQSYGVGAQQALRDYLEAAKDVAAQTKAAFTQAFQNIEDSIVDFVKTGKFSFQKFASDIEDSLIRIAVKAAAVQAITGGQTLFSGLFGGSTNAVTAGGGAPTGNFDNALGNFKFAGGGIMTGKGAATLQRYAAGGIASRPQLALFGEGSGPEAYVPLPDGRSIPVSMKGGGTSNSVAITVNMDGGGDSTKASSDDGRKLGVAIQRAVQQELVNQKRPGGILA